MIKKLNSITFLLFVSILCSCVTKTTKTSNKVVDPLPSWNEGTNKSAIINYVKDITNSKSVNFIPAPERIATFDNDGTLWSEQPMYFQLYFAIERIQSMAKEHPEWKDKQPYKAVIENNIQGLLKQGEPALFEILMTSHANNTTEEFEQVVKNWLETAKHPIKNKSYTALVYQPMLELLDYLRDNNFKTYIVSGGGIEFMRPWTEKVYGIPSEQVIGSSIKTKYEYNNGKPIIRRLPEIDFIDDKEGKPEAIHKFIGKKPIFSAGNSDGDLQMLRWAESSQSTSFMLYVHHTDSIREWAYDRNSHIGKFDKGLDEAIKKEWTIIDMEKDWKTIYPYELETK